LRFGLRLEATLIIRNIPSIIRSIPSIETTTSIEIMPSMGVLSTDKAKLAAGVLKTPAAVQGS
jgi:hypothetical protein